ncbi:MAG: CGLD27 family protein [Xenococcaceae cyanobacterium]
MRKTTVSFCPVPLEQRPINEYEELKTSWFFSWGNLQLSIYVKKLAWVSFWSLLISAPIAAASFSPTIYPIKFILTSLGGAEILLALVLVRLYLGWSYINDRLQRDRIFYEESGWYDGQTWLKPDTMLNRDRLIVLYEIKPIFRRLNRTFLSLLGLTLIGSITWLVLG